MKAFSLSQNWWQFLVVAIVCYLIGCFNFARVISRKKHKDITKIGSGNPGTMNMSREFGWKIGVLTFLCDALKGGIPALIAYFIYRDYYFAGTEFALAYDGVSFVAKSAFSVADFARYFCGLFVIIGHIFPVTTGFKGGKGIASTLGLFWFGLGCENGWWYLFVFLFFLFLVLFIFWTEWGSLGSLLGVSGLSIVQLIVFFVKYQSMPVNAYLVAAYACILAINLLTWIAHRANLARLFSGEEHHTSIKRLAKKK